jgi:ribose-phosphate pyrophosphokinase
MGPLADKIIAARQGEIRRGNIRWGRFPNGQWDLEVLEDPCELRRHSVSFLMGFTDPANQPAQLDVLDELVSVGPGRLQLLMPFHPTATNERKFKRGSVASAVSFGRRLTKTVGSERCNLYIYDVHAPAVLGMCDSNVKMRDETGTVLLKDWVATQDFADNIVFAFPDRGARTRFASKFDGTEGGKKYTMVACDKVRVGNKRIVTLSPGDKKKVKGRFVIVVDDLIRSGGTLLECVNAILAAGALKVGVYGTHADFEPATGSTPSTEERFMEAKNVAFALITDSTPKAFAVDGRGPFKVLSLAGLLADNVCDDRTITEMAMAS